MTKDKNYEITASKPMKVHFWRRSITDPWNASVVYNGKLSRLRSAIMIIRGDEILLSREEDEDASMKHNTVFVKMDKAVKHPSFKKAWKMALRKCGYPESSALDAMKAVDILRRIH